MGLLRRVTSFLFPTRCVSCYRTGYDLCRRCAHELEAATDIHVPLSFCASLFSYRHKTAKRCIRKVKYQGDTRTLDVLMTFAADDILDILSEWLSVFPDETPLFIPIPMSRKRTVDHVHYLAATLAKEYGMLSPVLQKQYKRIPQTSIKRRSERLRNMHEAFQVNRSDVVGAICIIIDDVTTTGATLKEAERALRAAGARVVYALTLAH